MLTRAQLIQVEVQAKLFEDAGKLGYDGKTFADGFMRSKTSVDFYSDYDRLQWLGGKYLLAEFLDESGLKPSHAPGDDNLEALFWAGYVYRYWNFLTGESPREINRQADATAMYETWLGYHTLSVEEAVLRLKDDAKVAQR